MNNPHHDLDTDKLERNETELRSIENVDELRQLENQPKEEQNEPAARQVVPPVAAQPRITFKWARHQCAEVCRTFLVSYSRMLVASLIILVPLPAIGFVGGLFMTATTLGWTPHPFDPYISYFTFFFILRSLGILQFVGILYFFPYFIAVSRGVGKQLTILRTNALTGWTGIGWSRAFHSALDREISANSTAICLSSGFIGSAGVLLLYLILLLSGIRHLNSWIQPFEWSLHWLFVCHWACCNFRIYTQAMHDRALPQSLPAEAFITSLLTAGFLFTLWETRCGATFLLLPIHLSEIVYPLAILVTFAYSASVIALNYKLSTLLDTEVQSNKATTFFRRTSPAWGFACATLIILLGEHTILVNIWPPLKLLAFAWAYWRMSVLVQVDVFAAVRSNLEGTAKNDSNAP